MKKVFFQFVVLAATFFGSWWLLNQVDFMKHFNIRHHKEVNEKKLGEQIWKIFKQSGNIIENDSVTASLHAIAQRLCSSNPDINIPVNAIKIHVMKKDEVNAFALPNYHLVIYSDLITDCKNADEVAGVMAHEIAHMSQKHVVKKMIKEVGLGVLLSASGGTTARELAKLLSSTAYDRTLESEADAYAVKYLANAQIDPVCLADFLLRMDEKSGSLPDAAYFISTHPNSKERAEEIKKLKSKTKFSTGTPVMSTEEWKLVQDLVEKAD